MSELQDNKKDQQVFAAIWDACRDMSGYVQMHFTPAQRGELFGWNWAMIPTLRLTDYRRLSHTSTDKAGAKIASIGKLRSRHIINSRAKRWRSMGSPSTTP